MNVSAYINMLTLALCGSLPARAPEEKDKLTFVNDIDDVVKQKVVEAKTWYAGDSDELLNLYFYNDMIEFRTEPYYWRNRRNFFWAVGAVEKEYKMTHSGFARDMVDTTVSICGTPKVTCADPERQARLEKILDDNGFWGMYRKVQMPMTLVCGWGGFRIDWDRALYGDSPCIVFKDAVNVRFHKLGSRVVGMTFFDWYLGIDGDRYLLAETRAKSKDGTYMIMCNTFREAGGFLSPCEEIPGIETPCKWGNMPVPFSVPCSFYEDNLHNAEGRGIFEGKIDLLDDLDQALSVQSNAVRRSTPIEVFDLDYCERDPKTKLPKLPKSFERKYVGVRGRKNAMGESAGNGPVQITQPQLNTELYNAHIETLERMIISGHLSPSSMGLDIQKRDGYDIARERNKETVFTRNHLIVEESAVLESLFNQVLIADEYLNTGTITCVDYGVSVEYDEFSDVSFESKLETMTNAFANRAMSPEMFVDKTYGKSISDEAKRHEVEFLTERLEQQRTDGNGFGDEGMEGASAPSAFPGMEEPSSIEPKDTEPEED